MVEGQIINFALHVIYQLITLFSSFWSPKKYSFSKKLFLTCQVVINIFLYADDQAGNSFISFITAKVCQLHWQ